MTSGINWLKNAVSEASWIHGTRIVLVNVEALTLETFVEESPRYKLSHDKSSSDNYKLFPCTN